MSGGISASAFSPAHVLGRGARMAGSTESRFALSSSSANHSNIICTWSGLGFCRSATVKGDANVGDAADNLLVREAHEGVGLFFLLARAALLLRRGQDGHSGL